MSEDESPTLFSLTLSASDADGDTLTWSIASAAAHGNASASGTGNSKVITYTPVANFYGDDSFVVEVSDGKGGVDTITVNVIVVGVNDAPVAIAQSVTTDEDTPKAITLTATDVDSSSLVYSIVTSPTNGTLSGTPPNVTYTPGANFYGSDSFTFKASDGSLESDPALVTITVNSVNDLPIIAEGDSTAVTMSEDGDPTFFSLTLHASDGDGDTLTWSIASAAAHGVASASGTGTSKEISYIPETNFNGTDSFVVRVSDGIATDTITVHVTVNAVNDAPVPMHNRSQPAKIILSISH
jgi:hypothetical protein